MRRIPQQGASRHDLCDEQPRVHAREQGQLDEAAKMKKEVLEKRRRILGEEHPDTISAMNNLANTARRPRSAGRKT